MIQLITIFFLVQMAVLARYIVFEKFEPISYASTYLFLLAAIFLYTLSKVFMRKELEYRPNNIDSWSFFNKQRIFNIEKPLYKGQEKRGSIQRVFLKKWHSIVADLINQSFFLALKVKIDQNMFEVKPVKGKWLSNQSYWTICKNGIEIGHAKTVLDFKNTAKLKEVIEIQLAERTYKTVANTVTSEIKIYENDEQMGQMTKNQLISNVNTIAVAEDSPEKIIALLLHAYHFKNA